MNEDWARRLQTECPHRPRAIGVGYERQRQHSQDVVAEGAGDVSAEQHVERAQGAASRAVAAGEAQERACGEYPWIPGVEGIEESYPGGSQYG